jgi:hypothetical protein
MHKCRKRYVTMSCREVVHIRLAHAGSKDENLRGNLQFLEEWSSCRPYCPTEQLSRSCPHAEADLNLEFFWCSADFCCLRCAQTEQALATFRPQIPNEKAEIPAESAGSQPTLALSSVTRFQRDCIHCVTFAGTQLGRISRSGEC